MHDLSKAKVVRTDLGQKFLLTPMRLYQPLAERGRYARTPWRYVALSSVKKAVKTGSSVVCHVLPVYSRVRGYRQTFPVATSESYFGPVLSIGCERFSGENYTAILGSRQRFQIHNRGETWVQSKHVRPLARVQSTRCPRVLSKP